MFNRHTSSRRSLFQPTRSAAIALFSIDAIFVCLPLIFRWQNGFAIAYIPLLFTVAIGICYSGIARWVFLSIGSVAIITFAGIALELLFLTRHFDRFATVLRLAQIILATLLGAIIFTSGLGWFRFFRTRPTMID